MSRPEIKENIERERAACLYFSVVQSKVGRSVTSRLGGRSLAEAASLGGIELASVARLSEKAAKTVDGIRRTFDAEEMLEGLSEIRARAVTLADADYPPSLRESSDPPPALYVRGTLPDFSGAAVAVVGSRKASVGALSVARDIGRRLAERGVVVVSGLALGTDAEAHRGALIGGGPTVGVLGCGVDIVYPKSNRVLFEEVIEKQGAIISEYLPKDAPLSWRFPARNRIIAGLCGATVVVEAADRSGSLITARYAMEEGREVWVVPGPLGMSECRGSNHLLADGASVIWDLDEFAGAFGEEKERHEDAVGGAFGDQAIPEGLKPDEVEVLTVIDFRPSAVDRIAARSGLRVDRLLSVLTMLELKGYVARDTSGAFVRKAVS